MGADANNFSSYAQLNFGHRLDLLLSGFAFSGKFINFNRRHRPGRRVLIPPLTTSPARWALFSSTSIFEENMQSSKQENELQKLGIFLIAISIFISFMVAISTDMSHQELGALGNYITPPMAGLVTLVIYIFATFLTRKLLVWKIVLGICCFYNLYVGVALYFQKENWPLIF